MKNLNKNTILTALIIIIVVGAVIWLSRPAPADESSVTASSQGSIIVALEQSFDFGNISMAQGNVSHVFKIKNSNTEAIQIKKLYTSCMCTTASLITSRGRKGPFGMPGHGFTPRINEEISTGEEAAIEVVFDPAAHGPAGVGPVERIIYIETPTETEEISIKAVVTP